MKIILTGATGFIGGEILEQCIVNRNITTVIVLTRKPIAEKYLVPNPQGVPSKVIQVLHDDFGSYPDTLITQLQSIGKEAPPPATTEQPPTPSPQQTTPHRDPLPIAGCIWALGGPVSSFPSLEQAQRVGIHYPIQAAEAFAKHLAPDLALPSSIPAPPAPLEPIKGLSIGRQKRRSQAPPPKFPFRFVMISGWGAERNPFRRLWVFGESRKIKGAMEKGVEDVGEGSAEVVWPPSAAGEKKGEGDLKGEKKRKCFEAVSLRPGGVLAKGKGEGGKSSLGTTIAEAVTPSVSVDKLARCAVKMVLDGPVVEGQRVVENGEILGDEWGMVNTIQR